MEPFTPPTLDSVRAALVANMAELARRQNASNNTIYMRACDNWWINAQIIASIPGMSVAPPPTPPRSISYRINDPELSVTMVEGDPLPEYDPRPAVKPAPLVVFDIGSEISMDGHKAFMVGPHDTAPEGSQYKRPDGSVLVRMSKPGPFGKWSYYVEK